MTILAFCAALALCVDSTEASLSVGLSRSLSVYHVALDLLDPVTDPVVELGEVTFCGLIGAGREGADFNG